ncbi:DUF2520 domain-containing protein [Microbacterium esteraromaticum]|uniref:DUF2520 domain-containing protein n=1 Tax=Microbacterium esteraromaticum TaxID=57043 RepID=A0A939DTZ6_9MICO|nr:DUF2520 domain-containing protein [Microbacterium esteraromaticum]MBN8204870.1 DUF2520 domain-containing protein [Microbacterium esteraromaticum]MBN8415024.1 DUF2520 domain-containing protein [Microbacterium esteraromaticum]
MTSFAPAPSDTTIAIIGAGRLGTTLARALRAARFRVFGPLGPGTPPRADIALLCVPDAAISETARATRPFARLIGHASGATPLNDVDFSIHPLQTFIGTEPPEIFHGITAAIAGRTPDALAAADSIARALGARPIAIDDVHRAEYHAAASFASNFVLTVLDAAEQLAERANIPPADARELLAPLIRQSVDNWVATGAGPVLTGPIARGDEATVARQRQVAEAAGLDELFDALADRTRALTDRPAA